MEQEIIVTDVTRMGEGQVCVAGVTHHNVTVRLIVGYPGIQIENLLLDDHCIIQPRAVLKVDIEPKADCHPPHTEDHKWMRPGRTQWLRLADETTWKGVLKRTASPCVAEIFGAELQKNRKIEPDSGERSLATIKAFRIMRFYCGPDARKEEEFACRLDFSDGDNTAFFKIPITDLAVNAYVGNLLKQKGLDFEGVAEKLTAALRRKEVFLRLGLTRPYIMKSGGESWCYLQVNGIYTFPDYLEGKCFADFLWL